MNRIKANGGQITEQSLRINDDSMCNLRAKWFVLKFTKAGQRHGTNGQVGDWFDIQCITYKRGKSLLLIPISKTSVLENKQIYVEPAVVLIKLFCLAGRVKQMLKFTLVSRLPSKLQLKWRVLHTTSFLESCNDSKAY